MAPCLSLYPESLNLVFPSAYVARISESESSLYDFNPVIFYFWQKLEPARRFGANLITASR